LENKIDLVGIQETKTKDFKQRTFNFLSSTLDTWFFKSSSGNSGGIF
jgi:hypothetical protein